jgi:signal transduction histidine kinase
VFEQAPVVIATLRGPTHVFEIQNAEHRTLFGGRDLVGQPIRQGLPELAGQDFLELLDRVYATGVPFVGSEARAVIDRGGGPEEAFFDFVYQPLVEADGETTGILWVATDVTAQVGARREVEAERASAEAERRRAEEANKAKADFLANMSHELRTPLNAISGHVQLVELGLHGPITDEQAAALARVQAAQRHLLRLINDVLNFAKLEAGKVVYDVQAVRLADVVAEVVPLIEPLMAARRQAFSMTLAEPAVEVWADREKLAQVLLNLLSNAVKFTPEGGRIAIDTLRAEDGATASAGTLQLRVSDTGRGIPPTKLESVFEPFVQVESGRTRTTEGTGLGLAISRDLARGMSGDLWARSVEGEGSVFTLALRRVVATDGTPTDRRTRLARRTDERRRARPEGAPGA